MVPVTVRNTDCEGNPTAQYGTVRHFVKNKKVLVTYNYKLLHASETKSKKCKSKPALHGKFDKNMADRARQNI
jgi:hypothetical protein